MDELGQNSKDHELVRREAGLNAQRATLARTTLVKEINTLSAENKELRDRMALLEQELKTCKASYEECDAERNILLTARGIIPKVNPVWAPMRSYSPVKVAVGAKDKISNEYEQKSSMKDIAENPARGMYMELNTWTYIHPNIKRCYFRDYTVVVGIKDMGWNVEYGCKPTANSQWKHEIYFPTRFACLRYTWI